MLTKLTGLDACAQVADRVLVLMRFREARGSRPLRICVLFCRTCYTVLLLYYSDLEHFSRRSISTEITSLPRLRTFIANLINKIGVLSCNIGILETLVM